MNSEELLNELESENRRLEQLRRNLQEESKRSWQLEKILESSLRFEMMDIILTISDLITFKEEEEYGLIVHNKNNFGRYNQLGIALSRDFVGGKAMRKYIKHYNDPQDTHSPDYIDIYKNDNYYDDPDLDNLPSIYFTNLLDKYHLYNYVKEQVYCYSDFKEYPYVNDFIEYLFNLQVQNNGKRLTYDEMQVALNDFLELEKGIPKQKIKEKDNK